MKEIFERSYAACGAPDREKELADRSDRMQKEEELEESKQSRREFVSKRWSRV